MERNKSNICPVCKEKLEQEILWRPNSSWVVNCASCGKYAMTEEFYEDRIESPYAGNDAKRLESFLKRHLSDKLRPYLSNDPIHVPEGYRNYPYFNCILTEDIVL